MKKNRRLHNMDAKELKVKALEEHAEVEEADEELSLIPIYEMEPPPYGIFP